MKKRKQKEMPEIVPAPKAIALVDYYISPTSDYLGYMMPLGGDRGYKVVSHTRFVDDEVKTTEIARFRKRRHAEEFLNKVRFENKAGSCCK